MNRIWSALRLLLEIIVYLPVMLLLFARAHDPGGFRLWCWRLLALAAVVVAGVILWR